VPTSKAKTKGNKGTQFESDLEIFFKKFLKILGYTIIEVRNQKSGTQNGFDVRVRILDSYNNEKNLYFECKFYDSVLDWSEISTKIIQIDATGYKIDGFIALSPKVDISNIDDAIYHPFCAKYYFPIKLWTPQGMVDELFSIDADFYESIYGIKPTNVDTAYVIKKYKALIENILQEKECLSNCYTISIEESKVQPKESQNLKTNLDNKLNSILDSNDAKRMEYHQRRCDYKIYLEKLQDQNNSLRLKIEKWEDNLRLKAERLTNNFNIDDTYTAKKFFHDFFIAADESLTTFFKLHTLDGDLEKLLNGVIFELAAKCPLNWVKNDGTVYSA